MSWFKRTNGHAHNVSDAEQYELLEEDLAPPRPRMPGKQPSYEEGATIDWQREEAAERERKRVLASQRGFHGLLSLVLDSCGMWLVIILTGLGTGVAGAWLDILVRWLGDLKEGRCTYGFFYNQVTCCSGLDPGEVCNQWQTWSEHFNIKLVFAQSILQSFIYITLGSL